MDQFLNVNPPRTFGSASITDRKTGETVHCHELIDGKWVETPEYKEMMKK